MKNKISTFISSTAKVNWKAIKSNGFPILLALILLVIVSCTSLIIVNYYTIKTLSALRAFINGESQYSKAQKDGSRNLLLYLNQRDESFYHYYSENIKINIGDSLALNGFFQGRPLAQLTDNFIIGNNNIEDADDMIWLLKNFSGVSFFKKCIYHWRDANNMIRVMDIRASSIRQQVLKGNYTSQQAIADSKDINNWDNSLTKIESEFSDTLEHASRSIRQNLLICDFTMIFLIVGFTGAYSAITVKRLFFSAQALATKNQYLIDTNAELDRFVYSASHDLRAPITSLKGLVQIIKEEDDLQQIRHYLEYMDRSLNQQDEFIREIINYSRNKRTDLTLEKLKLSKLIDSTINQHYYMSNLNEIEFFKDLSVDTIYSDPLRLKIIFNNLVSNAIKFSDPSKFQQKISISCHVTDQMLKIEVEDNGIGIQPHQKDKIFDMFYVTLHENRGSGLGLYITKETVSKLGGRIEVASEVGEGSCFTLYIPLAMKLKQNEALSGLTA